MYSTLHWVRRGVLARQPQRAEPNAVDLQNAKARSAMLAHSSGMDIHGNPLGSEDAERMAAQEALMASSGDGGLNDAKDNGNGNDNDDDEDDDEGWEDMDDEEASADAKDRAQQLIDEFYPSEDEGQIAAPGGMGGVLGFDDQDPYLQLRDDDGDDDSEIEDFEILPGDSVLVVGKSEEEFSSLEMHVYEEGEANLYVHHDMMIPAFPLSLSVLEIVPGDSKGTPGNFVAVGSFRPEIEIWNLDVVDSLEPYAVLGGVDPESLLPKKDDGKKPKKGKKKSKKIKPEFLPGSHKDAVLSLSHNKLQPNLLASGSADGTVKVWDLTTLDCVQTFDHHAPSKVQVVAWNPEEASVLLDASFDKTATIIDVRSSTLLKFPLGSDAEQALWDPHNAQHFYASNDAGQVFLFDLASENPERPVFTIHAHDDAVSALTVSPHIKDLLATGSTDKTFKLWHIVDSKRPTCVFSRDFSVGPVFCASFSPDMPLTVAIAGGSSRIVVWDATENSEIRAKFAPLIDAEAPRPAGTVAYEPIENDDNDETVIADQMLEAMAIGDAQDDGDDDDHHHDGDEQGESMKEKIKSKKKNKKGKK